MAQRQRPGDYTGVQKAKLAQEHADAVAQREGELAMMEAAQRAVDASTVVDYSQGPQPLVLDDVETVAQADAEISRERQAVALGEELVLDGSDILAEAPYRTVMVNDVLEKVTIGAGNFYDFEPGKKYRVPAHVAAHLEEKGFLYH